MIRTAHTMKRFCSNCVDSPPLIPSLPSSYSDICFHHITKSLFTTHLPTPPSINLLTCFSLPFLNRTSCNPPLEGEKGALIPLTMIWKLQHTSTCFCFSSCAVEPIKTAALLCVTLDLCTYLFVKFSAMCNSESKHAYQHTDTHTLSLTLAACVVLIQQCREDL